MRTADKRFKRALQLVLTLALVGVVLPGVGKQTQTAPNVKEQFTPLIRSVEGPDLFRAFCTPCHGVDAKGGGPAAAALKAAEAQVDEMCRRLLANPVIEDYRFSLEATAATPRPAPGVR